MCAAWVPIPLIPPIVDHIPGVCPVANILLNLDGTMAFSVEINTRATDALAHRPVL
jgi:hypothetical protein